MSATETGYLAADLNSAILKFSFLAGAVYFVCMATAHVTGFKVPILFVYYDVPSNHYQDMIIAFCAATYAILFFAASRIRAIAPYAIAALAVTVLGLANVNMSEALRAMIGEGATTAYWLQTGMIGGLVAWLSVFYLRSKG